MRTLASAVILCMVFFQQSCDLRKMMGLTPEQIQSRADAAMRPYFPREHTYISQPQQALFVFTCTTNLGIPALEQIRSVIEQDPSYQQLRTFQGLTGVRFLVLGFDSHLLVLDLATGFSGLQPTSRFQDYSVNYARECGLQPAPGSPGTTQSGTQGFIWIGVFDVRFRTADGVVRDTTITDGLGIYTEADFAEAKEAELRAREEIIRTQFGKRNFGEVLEVKLRTLTRRPF